MTPDEKFMRQALRLAAKGRGRTAPNPMVGCVIVRRGRVLATGWHHRAGMPHAEVDALAKLDDRRAPGATVYVTLEPCDHHGRTPPCSDALVRAGVARVVAAMLDPHDIVAGRGLAKLRGAGISVAVGVLEDEARALNAGYLHWLRTGRPRVTLKAAVTLDGRLAARSGDSKWVTGEAARREVHRMRDHTDAILVGAGTVIADDPQLTTRLGRGGTKDPLRVILDGKLAIPPSARVIRAGTIVIAAAGAPAERAAALTLRGAEVVRLAGDGAIDLGALLDELGRRGCHELLVEGGGQVHGAFLAAGLASRVVAFVAPKLVGAGGVPFVAVPGPLKMSDAWTLGDVTVKRLGDDVMIAGTPVAASRE